MDLQGARGGPRKLDLRFWALSIEPVNYPQEFPFILDNFLDYLLILAAHPMLCSLN